MKRSGRTFPFTCNTMIALSPTKRMDSVRSLTLLPSSKYISFEQFPIGDEYCSFQLEIPLSFLHWEFLRQRIHHVYAPTLLFPTFDHPTITTKRREPHLSKPNHLTYKNNPLTLTSMAPELISPTIKPTLLSLPLSILRQILTHLLISPHPLILQRSPFPCRSPSYHTNIHTSILRVHPLFYNTGLPLLYGANTLTASSPTTSVNFDTVLQGLPGRVRQMIRSVRLEVGWGKRFCEGFALVAKELGGLLGLRSWCLFLLGGRRGWGGNGHRVGQRWKLRM